MRFRWCAPPPCADCSSKTFRPSFRRWTRRRATVSSSLSTPLASAYRSVVDALNFKREAEGLAEGKVLATGVAISGTWDGATVAVASSTGIRLAPASGREYLVAQVTALLCSYWWGARF